MKATLISRYQCFSSVQCDELTFVFAHDFVQGSMARRRAYLDSVFLLRIEAAPIVNGDDASDESPFRRLRVILECSLSLLTDARSIIADCCRRSR